MKLRLTRELSDNFRNVFRRLGYSPDANVKSGDESYSRRISGGQYPRYHVYINPQPDNTTIFSLHMDMKKPSYQGSHAHSAEYEGELVAQEIARIKNFMATL
ncbi:MAG: hypothetical protein V1838_00245 [Patescibacteria group bacterium]